MNVELNITMRCNCACPGCNRLIPQYPERTEDIDPAAVEQFIAEAKEHGHVNRVKVVGGEPLLHPQFSRIAEILADGIQQGAIQSVKIDTNGTLPKPPLPAVPGMRYAGRQPGAKRHLPFLHSPIDLGHAVVGPCSMPFRCGVSLDARGWLPCSSAIMIARLFGCEHLYRQHLPAAADWGFEELCPDCAFAMPAAWRAEHAKALRDFTEEDRTPSERWKARLWSDTTKP
ncbi:MAG: radical SAM protein [Planctomycetaceae bacterium]